MKKRIPFAVLALCTIAAGIVYADLQLGSYRPEQLGSLRQPAPPDLSPDSLYAVPAYPVPGTDLAPGDGVQDVRIYCSVCHSPSYITMQPPLPAAEWEAEVSKMQHAFGAEIPPDSSRKIIQYLQSHYTPETRKP